MSKTVEANAVDDLNSVQPPSTSIRDDGDEELPMLDAGDGCASTMTGCDDNNTGDYSSEKAFDYVSDRAQPSSESGGQVREPSVLGLHLTESDHALSDHDDYFVIQQQADREELVARCRYLNAFFDAWPRCTAIVCRIVLPLWVLIFIALGFGRLLARFEAPLEYEQNDQIAMERFVLGDALQYRYGMSRSCVDCFSRIKGNSSTLHGDDVWTTWNSNEEPSLEAESGSENATINSMLGEISDCLAVCANVSEGLVDAFASTASSELTFNWIRCWNTTLYGDTNPFRATSEQIAAADNQTDYFFEAWKLDQERLIKLYLTEYSCDGTDLNCVAEAYNQSVSEASGSWSCGENTGGSSWFWFTGMFFGWCQICG
jgi:hypothetical protein